MSKIKLFSGMDFSGKSTTISLINKRLPNVFKSQSKFITPIKTLEIMIDRDIWLPREKFIPLLIGLVTKDIANYKDCGPVLQDTLWVIKFVARLCAEDSDRYHSEIVHLLQLIDSYPDVDSFYLTATMEERMKRYNMRVALGKRISQSDRLVFSYDIFEKTETHYRNIILKIFPRTKVIDTTFSSPENIVDNLMKEKIFLKDL